MTSATPRQTPSPVVWRGVRLWRGVASVIVVLALSEIIGRLANIDPIILPRTSSVLVQAVKLLGDGAFLSAVGTTLEAWLIGLLIATGAGALLGIAMGAIRPLEVALRPITEFLRPLPSVTLVPLFLLLLQSDESSEIATIAFGALWPILINTLYGMRDVDPLVRETMAAFGFDRLSVLGRVSLPATAPFIATGVRLGAAVALVVAISAELLSGGTSGIGSYLAVAQSAPDSTTVTVAVVVWSGLLGLLIDVVLARLQRSLFGWHFALHEAAA
jgi:NitT/TauT family transport system permease protein